MIEQAEEQNDKNVLGDHSSVSSDNDSRSNIAQCVPPKLYLIAVCQCHFYDSECSFSRLPWRRRLNVLQTLTRKHSQDAHTLQAQQIKILHFG